VNNKWVIRQYGRRVYIDSRKRPMLVEGSSAKAEVFPSEADAYLAVKALGLPPGYVVECINPAG